MKTRMTFRVAEDLAEALRTLPNQTAFVESALREALGRTCPTCEGRGRLAQRRLAITDFRRHGLPKLDRARALSLKRVVRVGRDLGATDLGVRHGEQGLSFVLDREGDVLLRGALSEASA